MERQGVNSAPEEDAKAAGLGRLFTCAGCRGPITDQYLYQVSSPDLEWHAHCLRCADCGLQLDEQNTCFVKDGRTYCKSDYLRLFGIKCFGCRLGFEMADLVMKARHRIYHVDCFRCSVCRRKLVPGDEYAVSEDNDALFCRHDYDTVAEATGGGVGVGTSSHTPSCASPPELSGQGPQGGAMDGWCVSHPPPGVTRVRVNEEQEGDSHDDDDERSDDVKTTKEMTRLSSHRACVSSSNSSSSNCAGPGDGVTVLKGCPGAAAAAAAAVGNKKTCGGTGSTTKSTGSGFGGGRSHKSEQKTTRVRTVLNEKQLHTLRTCYAANPRPDALMKDQLVEMTGLSSRVIRVWFQNKRCKDKKRTILIKQIQQQQQQHHHHPDKFQGIPLIATSPVRHDPPTTLHATPVEVHQFIHHPSQWHSSPSTDMGVGAPPVDAESVADFASVAPALIRHNGQISADLQDSTPPQGQGQPPAFQQLMTSFGESDDDDTIVSLEEPSIFQALHQLQHHNHLDGVGGRGAPGTFSMRRMTRLTSDLHSSHLNLRPLGRSILPFSSIGGHLIPPPAHLPPPPPLQAFDAKC